MLLLLLLSCVQPHPPIHPSTHPSTHPSSSILPWQELTLRRRLINGEGGTRFKDFYCSGSPSLVPGLAPSASPENLKCKFSGPAADGWMRSSAGGAQGSGMILYRCVRCSGLRMTVLHSKLLSSSKYISISPSNICYFFTNCCKYKEKTKIMQMLEKKPYHTEGELFTTGKCSWPCG